MLGSLIALGMPAVGLALFAVDREGRIVHKFQRDGGAFAPGGQAWRMLQGPRAGSLAAEPAEDGDILVSVLTEDRFLHLLHWRDWPNGRPERRWQKAGPIDELQPLRPMPALRTERKKPTARSQRIIRQEPEC